MSASQAGKASSAAADPLAALAALDAAVESFEAETKHTNAEAVRPAASKCNNSSSAGNPLAALAALDAAVAEFDAPSQRDAAVAQPSSSLSGPAAASTAAPAVPPTVSALESLAAIDSELAEFEQSQRQGPVVTSTVSAAPVHQLMIKQDVAMMRQQDAAAGQRSATGGSASSSGDKEAKPVHFYRSGGGATWEDPSLAEWPENDFRLFCGNLGKEVTDDVLERTFFKYKSFAKAKVVRTKSGKTKGFGFVSFLDPNDFTQAFREMDGKYIGLRPVKLRRSTWQDGTKVTTRKRRVTAGVGARGHTAKQGRRLDPGADDGHGFRPHPRHRR